MTSEQIRFDERPRTDERLGHDQRVERNERLRQEERPGAEERPRPEENNAGPAPRPKPPQPESVEEALREALDHARNAMAEGLLAGRSLIDAACLALFGEPARLTPDAARDASDARVAFAAMARGMDELAGKVRSTDAMTAANDTMMRTMLDALDAEIGRWERRSAHDSDARAVLRAFLGLREILWEFGHSRAETPEQPAAEPRPAPAASAATAHAADAAPRVQRVKVQG
jgi:hypothetical protein